MSTYAQQFMATPFNYHPLVIGAALRMELALIARGFTTTEVTVGRNHRYLIFDAHLPTRTVRPIKVTVNIAELELAISADVAIERAVRQFDYQAMAADAALQRRGRRIHGWNA